MIIGVAIIGMGSQGARRAPIYNAYQDCKLIGICDKIPSKKTFADTYHCDFSTDVDYFLKRNDVDLVQISTNASQQHHIAIKALEYGKHVAIEKPFTTKLEHGKEIAYNKKGLVFVEASERCNPAVLRLKEYVQDFSKVARMYHRRSGIFDPRINDVGVMLDLGFHEFDMGYFLTGKKPKVIYADLSEIMPSGYEHDARVFARFGKTASTIDVSWATKFKIRTLELTTAKENIILDYAGQKIRRQTQPENYPEMNKQRNTYQFIKWLSNLPESDLSVPNGEPFQMEIATIVESVKSGEVLPPLCSGKDALVTLEALKEALAFKGG